MGEKVLQLGVKKGGTVHSLWARFLHNLKIPLPPLEVQRGIVAELEAERKLVETNRELIARMEAKTQAKLAEVWGEEAEGGKEEQKAPVP
jgi:type I restriction enzyme M protein